MRTFVRAKNLNHKYIGRRIVTSDMDGIYFDEIVLIEINKNKVVVEAERNIYTLEPEDKVYLVR